MLRRRAPRWAACAIPLLLFAPLAGGCASTGEDYSDKIAFHNGIPRGWPDRGPWTQAQQDVAARLLIADAKQEQPWIGVALKTIGANSVDVYEQGAPPFNGEVGLSLTLDGQEVGFESVKDLPQPEGDATVELRPYNVMVVGPVKLLQPPEEGKAHLLGGTYTVELDGDVVTYELPAMGYVRVDSSK